MSHICVYFGKGGCLLEIPFRYCEIIGWCESFENSLMHTALDRALLTPHSPLYRQPLVYYHVSMRAHFLHMYQWDIHSLIMHVVSIFKDFVFRLCGMSPQLHDNFSSTIWNFPVSDCFPDNRTASSLIFGNSGCVGCLFDGKINNFKLLGS